MSDSGFRWFMLSAAAGTVLAWPPVSSVGHAAELVLVAADRHADSAVTSDFTVKIVAGGAEVGTAETSGIEIVPFGQTDEENDVPILVAPTDDAESEEKKAAKKPSKSGAKKSDKAPAATESGSRKARAEWQKKRAAENQRRKPKSQTSAKSDNAKSDKSSDDDRSKKAASKADKSAVAEQKKALLAKKAADKSLAAANAAAADAKVAKSASNRPDCPPAHAQIDSRRYREIYRSIPFSRAEYDWNPGYRHQATMEMLLGQLHPVIVAPAAPATVQPQPKTGRTVTIRFLPIIRPGYRSYSRYPWH